jgi:hypothetical protein
MGVDPAGLGRVNVRETTGAVGSQQRAQPESAELGGQLFQFVVEKAADDYQDQKQMLDLNYQRMIIGYHGCDANVVTKVLSGEDALAPSEKDYDWLGPGIYFFKTDSV